MKTNAWWLWISLALFATSQGRLAAQSSCFTFTDDYAMYTAVSRDGTNIYTSVLVDGSGTMNITGGQGCGSINYSGAVHTPIAVNVITAPNGATVGGGLAGEGLCPTCYLSVTNNQSVAATSGVEYTFSSAGAVDCSFVGMIFDVSLPSSPFKASQTFGTLIGRGTDAGDNNPIGYYTSACSVGVDHCPLTSTWGVEFGKGETVPQFVKTPFVALWVNGSVAYCVAGVSSAQTGPGPCY